MPLYDFKCPRCGKVFEELAKDYKTEVRCPKCGVKAVRQWAGEMHSATGKPPKKCSGNCETCEGC